MKKIPTLFVRDYSRQPALVHDGRMCKIKCKDFGFKRGNA